MSVLSDISIAHRCGVELVQRTFDPGHAHHEMQEYYRILKIGKETPMIHPFVPAAVREEQRPTIDGSIGRVEFHSRKIVSYGLSAYGYDVRLANKFKIFTNVKNSLIDPLNPDDNCYHEHEGDYCIIPPNSYILGHTMETFDMPRDILAECLGKSTYARLGAIVNVTPIEPGFKGTVVIEISNSTNLPLKVYAGMGISQFIFHKGDQPCLVSYADKGGKYQNQSGLTTARL